MSGKRKTPYEYLMTDIREFCLKIQNRSTKTMWLYPKNKLQDGWDLRDLNERVAAAKQLGYDVILESADDGLRVVYIKKLPDIPWRWK